MDSASSTTSLSSGVYWQEYHLSKPGNNLFCEIDADYITDRFNLTNLNLELPHFSRALKLITDAFDEELDVSVQGEVDVAARHLWGLVHARFLLTGAGMVKMGIKFKNKEFGVCPRVLCDSQPVLPIGLSDISGERSVKMFCPCCQDVYVSADKLHHHIDGAYFGTTFPHIEVTEVYQARIFGFKVHSAVENVEKRKALRDATGSNGNRMGE